MKTLALTLALAALAAPAAAQDFSAALQGFYDSELQALAHDAGVLAAVRAQNEANAGMTQEQINQRFRDQKG